MLLVTWFSEENLTDIQNLSDKPFMLCCYWLHDLEVECFLWTFWSA